ncbi:xylogalacturonan beta-1,3-xylosyltransferase-like [Euphorbia lathyris]|uniref:xylogalacturonan beta-1,3-xylosyltransferase-like n=1 Tax=Euphorbia lathyris TaxID=212925 RepID=UPI0033136BFA
MFPSYETHLTLHFNSFNLTKQNYTVTTRDELILSSSMPIYENKNKAKNVETKKNKKKKSNLDRIEEGLARARAAILQSSRSTNYSSHNNFTFFPRGSIYLNPYSFFQSHKEMVRRFKVWTYKEGEIPLAHEGPSTGVYGFEGQFINEIESPRSPFKAQNPEEAHLFFIPLSVTAIVQYIYLPITTMAEYSRDRLRRVVTDYVRVVANKYPYWNTSNGADHFMLSCHDWAPDISHGNPELFSNLIRVLCNANTTEGFEPKRDVSLPEIYISRPLHPENLGQTPKKRKILAYFEGRPHGWIREILFRNWKGKDNEIIVRESTPNGRNYRKMLGMSKYCLCPSGYEVASPRVVDSIYQGCVPVIISNNYSLPFSDVLNWKEFSVQIPVEKIGEMKEILKAISERKYLKMYRKVKMVHRHFVMNRPAKPFDVTYMILHSLWLRRLNFRLHT